MWVHYGPVFTWDTGSYYCIGVCSFHDSTLGEVVYSPKLADYTVRVDLQMTAGNGETGGVLALCNIRFWSSRGVRYNCFLLNSSFLRACNQEFMKR